MHEERLLQELQAILYAEIPLTQNIQIGVVSYADACLTLSAPLAANINHKGTVFAGSLNAVATLSGWGLLWLIVHKEGLPAHIVIQDSRIRYVLPVTKDFRAECHQPAPATVARFLATLRQRGMARLELSAVVYEQDKVALEFSGRFVATLHPEHAQ